MHVHCTKAALPTVCAFASCAGRLAELRANPDYHIAVAEGAPAGTSRQSISSVGLPPLPCCHTRTVTAAGRHPATHTHTHPVCCYPNPLHSFYLADISSGRLLGTAALIIERKFIHSCGKVRAATRPTLQAAQQQAWHAHCQCTVSQDLECTPPDVCCCAGLPACCRAHRNRGRWGTLRTWWWTQLHAART